jgi:hypothetical protein
MSFILEHTKSDLRPVLKSTGASWGCARPVFKERAASAAPPPAVTYFPLSLRGTGPSFAIRRSVVRT